MINKRYILCLVSLVSLVSLEATAQEGSYRYDDATQLWRLTNNAAGLGFDINANRGYAEVSAEHHEGDYRRVQEGGQRNQLQFTAERYQKISMLLVGYGRFQFDMDRTKDRSWCDVMRPYNSNPFFSGSSISGKYDTQDFDLTAAISTIPIPVSGGSLDREFSVGLRLDYKVGDLSRLRDPRSRSELLDYKITPGIVYTTGKHTLGADAYYHRRKEKIPNITTVQEEANITYYLMSGLEHAAGTVAGYKGYNREWVNHEFGGELSYNYQADGLNSLNTAGIARGVENVYGTYKYEPGKYTSFIYKVASMNRVKAGNLLHHIDLQMDFTEGYADEYRQQLIQERDAEKGYTSYHYETQIEYRKRYQVKVLNADFHYRCSMVADESVNAYAGFRFSLQDVKNRHLLPQSDFSYDHFNFMLEGGKAFLKDRLWVDLSATYHLSKNAELSLPDNAPVSLYAQQVLIPDMDYYEANYWQGHAEIKYQFPIKLKGKSSMWYVKAYGDYLRTNNHLDGKTVGLSVGLFN